MLTWTRCLEFASLAMTTWTFPVAFIIMVFFWIFYFVPESNTAIAPYINYPMIFGLFFIDIIWNSRFGPGGKLWTTAFMHYLKYKETEEDRNTARETWLAVFF